MNISKVQNLSIRSFWLCLGVLLLVPSANAKGEPFGYSSVQEQRRMEARSRQFAQLWLSRHRRNITASLLRMLQQERQPGFRRAIVTALGRLEDPQAVKPLQVLLEQAQQARLPGKGIGNQHNRIPLYQIQLAIARIQTRKLKGTAKLNAIARSVGTTWFGLQRTAEQLRAKNKIRGGTYAVQQMDERFIIEEFYDILYVMGKRGENIKKLNAFNLVIWSNEANNISSGLRAQEQAKLLVASLSDRAEIDFWLRRALPPSTAFFSPAHLLDLGPQVPDVLMNYLRICLRQAKANPQVMSRTNAYSSLFKTASATGDRRFLPILREFEKVNDRWTKIDARDAELGLTSGIGLATVRFP